tara:strand:+ start:994 stop:1260 length:267 start_codon:yes stop_codon:yes gene_type:complete
MLRKKIIFIKSMITKEQILNECMEILNREDVKNEFKKIMKPLIELLLKDIYPYIYLSIIFVIISFLLILGIFVLLMRNKFLHKKYETL